MSFFCIETIVIVAGLHVGLRNFVRGGVTMVVPFPGIRADSWLEWKRDRGIRGEMPTILLLVR